MTLLTTILHEIIGLFWDDGSLALAILGVVAVLALALYFGLDPSLAGPALFVASTIILIENVLRSARKQQ